MPVISEHHSSYCDKFAIRNKIDHCFIRLRKLTVPETMLSTSKFVALDELIASQSD